MELVEGAGMLRGILINDVITIERIIDDYIAQHFCKDLERRVEFLEYVICQDGISFERKRLIFKNILIKYHSEIATKYKNELKWIEDIIVERNIVAHYLLDNSIDAKFHYKNTKEIRFVKIKMVKNWNFLIRNGSQKLVTK